MRFRFSADAVTRWVEGQGAKPCADEVAEVAARMTRAGVGSDSRAFRQVASQFLRKLADAIERENKQAAEQVAKEAA